MADDTYSRGYRNDRHDRGGPGDSAPDPLTELARLIGQSDPFAPDRKRHADQHPAPYAQPYDTGAHDDRYGAAGEPQQYADSPHGPAEGYAADQNGYAYPQATQHEAGYGDTSGYGEQQPYHQDQQAYQPDQQAYQQDEHAYHHDQHAAYHQDQPPYAQSEPPYFGQASAAPEPADEGDDVALHPDQHGGYPAPPFFGDPNYDDAPAPRRGWVVTAAALVGLAVVGTAGAFAYRAVFTGSETRIITRDVGPSKITPVQTGQDSANKPSDRLASAGQNERLGPPAEQPIAIPEPPRTVPPALGQNQPQAPAPVLPAPPSAATPPMDPAGPPARVVRTERIKPADQPGDATTSRPAGPARAGTSPAVQPPQPRVAAQAPAAPAANAPLSLAPQGFPNTAAPAPPPHTTAVASTGPAVERNGGGSGYYVQVSAQKSEDEAKSSFRGIQARHASLLGGQHPVIRRKDLGSKGVFYGAQVGPFSREAAVKLCEDLKAAGQSCMIQKN
jgi:sporulation related protein